jgi:hypothetical protein
MEIGWEERMKMLVITPITAINPSNKIDALSKLYCAILLYTVTRKSTKEKKNMRG